MRMQLLRGRWATSRELQLESTVLSLEQIRIYWSSGQRKKAPEWQWCLGKCIVCHGRTAEDPSETGQVFCQQLSLWHTQILSCFCANTLLLSTSLCFFETLKGWRNLLLNITFCWMMPVSILRKRHTHRAFLSHITLSVWKALLFPDGLVREV